MERLSSMLYLGGSQQQYRYDTVGNPVGYTTRAKLRFTEAGWRALQTNLGDVLRAAAPLAPSGPQPLPADAFWAPIHSAIKTVNVHAQDGKYNADTLATFEQAATQLDAYQAKTAPERAMKKAYLAAVADVRAAIKAKTATAKHEQFLHEPKPAARAARSERIQARISEMVYEAKQKARGHAVADRQPVKKLPGAYRLAMWKFSSHRGRQTSPTRTAAW